MFTAVMLPVNHHDTPTAPGLVPCAAAPATVPKSTLGLEGTLGEGTAGFGVAGRRWMGDPFGGWLPARSAMSFGSFDAVTGGGADMLAYELVCNLIAHDGRSGSLRSVVTV